MKDITLKVKRSELATTMAQYSQKGYTPIMQGDTVVTMRKKKKFQIIFFLLFLLLFVVPALFVVLSYFVDSDSELTIYVTE